MRYVRAGLLVLLVAAGALLGLQLGIKAKNAALIRDVANTSAAKNTQGQELDSGPAGC